MKKLHPTLASKFSPWILSVMSGSILAVGTYSFVSHAEETDSYTNQTLQIKTFDSIVSKRGCILKDFGLYRSQFNSSDTESDNLFKSSWSATTYSVDKTECIGDFAVVQFIKGCVFDSYFDKTSQTIIKTQPLLRTSRGENISFLHKDWEIDSTDRDAMYGGDEDWSLENHETRHALYMVPKKSLLFKNDPKSIAKDHQILSRGENRYYLYSPEAQALKPTRVFVKDIPSGGSRYVSQFDNPQATTIKAQNSSLQFKVCVYFSEDVPSDGSDPKDFNTSLSDHGPIHCFDWNSTFIYDFKTKSFDETNQIHNACSS